MSVTSFGSIRPTEMTFAAALLRSLLSAGYWFAVLVIVYALVAGDPREPATRGFLADAAPWLVVVAGVLLHAMLVRLWERRR